MGLLLPVVQTPFPNPLPLNTLPNPPPPKKKLILSLRYMHHHDLVLVQICIVAVLTSFSLRKARIGATLDFLPSIVVYQLKIKEKSLI